ncbi:DinB family protein [Tsukamurella sputi]|uniref:DinB family protein n=1 Tax=Tsukamurella sputi TaxID=2591848 RepID=A0A5C5RSW3_9ACTN|nr:DinB family protein [Tsukamurella sputi]TWS25722.1 DinB family protein [Tsukamurella sputi]
MTIDWNAEIRAQIEDHWTRQLRPHLAGLTDDEYLWEPVEGMWTVRPADGGFVADFAIPPPEPAPVTTIGWRLGHLIFLLDSGLERFGHPAVDFATYRYPETAERALHRLDDAYRAWSHGVEELSVDDLAAAAGTPGDALADWSTLSIVLHTQRELIHHGAEITLLRDLFRARPLGDCP